MAMSDKFDVEPHHIMSAALFLLNEIEKNYGFAIHMALLSHEIYDEITDVVIAERDDEGRGPWIIRPDWLKEWYAIKNKDQNND